MSARPPRWAGVGLLAGGLGVLCACAPPTSLPPPIPAAGDLGLGAQLSGGWGYRPGPAGEGDQGGVTDLSAWGLARLDRWELGGVAFAGLSSQLGGGIFARLPLGGSPRWVVAPQVELGAAWGGLALPAAWSPRPGLWLHSQPALRLGATEDQGFTPTVLLPLGLGWERGERVIVLVEGGGRAALTGARCPDGASLSPYRQHCLLADGSVEPAEARQLTVWLSVGVQLNPAWTLP